jgi:hypothetical protein
MRWSILLLAITAGSALAGEPNELVTAPDAVLCLRAESLEAAGVGQNAKNQGQLRQLGCLRSPAGVPATLLSGSDGTFIWSVRYRPGGISEGITLWGRPSAFTRPDGTALPTLKAEK